MKNKVFGENPARIPENNDLMAGEAVIDQTQLSPDKAGAMNTLGSVYAERGDYINAESSFRKAIEIDSQNGIAHYNLGLIHSRQSRCTEAIEDFHRALEINPADFASHNDLGVLYHSRGELELARTHFIKALEANVLYKKALMNLFDVGFDSESYSEGLAWIEKYLNALFSTDKENANYVG